MEHSWKREWSNLCVWNATSRVTVLGEVKHGITLNTTSHVYDVSPQHRAWEVMLSPLLDRKNQSRGFYTCLFFIHTILPTHVWMFGEQLCVSSVSCSALHLMSALCDPCRKRLEQQQKMLEEDRKRRQFEEQKQKLRLLSSVKPKVRLSPQLAYFICF